MTNEFQVQCIANPANQGLTTGVHLTRLLDQSGRERLPFSDAAALLDTCEIDEAMSQNEVSMSDLSQWRGFNHTVHGNLFVAGGVPLADAANMVEYVRTDEIGSATFTVELVTEDLPELSGQVLQQMLAVGRDELHREVLRALGRLQAHGLNRGAVPSDE